MSKISVRAAFVAVVCILLACTTVGCSARPLGIETPRVADLGPREGLVYGSFLVVVDEQARLPHGKHQWYGPEARRTHYELNLHRRGSIGKGVASSHRYVRTRAWEVEPFVAVMPIGTYDASRMNMYIGTQEKVVRRLVDTKVDFRFEVDPGVATYLGRMIVAVPPKMVPGKTMVDFWVEDHSGQDAEFVGLD